MPELPNIGTKIKILINNRSLTLPKNTARLEAAPAVS
jgi:hypothetical protein